MPSTIHHGAPETVVVLPVFDDWDALARVLQELDHVLGQASLRADALVVDDGSTRAPSPALRSITPTALRTVEVLRLRRNVGHQRAIAIALAFLHERRHYRSVVVMDADGEDRPSDVPRLLARLEREPKTSVVFAERVRRSESLTFTLGYRAYRLVHRVLTGVAVRVGNFSALSFDALTRLVSMSELWNHFAAAVFRSRIPYDMIPTERGTRVDGRSSMNVVSLTAHGVSAISVFGDIVGVRLLIGALIAAAGLAVAWAATMLLARAAVRGWALVLAFGLLLVLLQTALACILFLFVVQSSRTNSSFLLIRDYRYFILEEPRVLCTP